MSSAFFFDPAFPFVKKLETKEAKTHDDDDSRGVKTLELSSKPLLRSMPMPDIGIADTLDDLTFVSRNF